MQGSAEGVRHADQADRREVDPIIHSGVGRNERLLQVAFNAITVEREPDRNVDRLVTRERVEIQ